MLDMRKNGLAEATIESRTRNLRQLARLANLKDPEQVKTAITGRFWKDSTKKKFFASYYAITLYMQIEWKRPHITPQDKIPFIPTGTEIDQLVASCGTRTATLLQTLKEVAARISEAARLKWTDLSTEQKTLNITPSKGSNARILRISDKLINMLNQLPHNRPTIFQTDIDSLRTIFTNQRKLAPQKLQNPRILKISFHTFRHYAATMEYHKTKDIIHVMQFLGHKNIKNTMIYINIEQALFLEQNDQWTIRTAKTVEEATKLLETGFEYVQDIDGTKLYRKRK